MTAPIHDAIESLREHVALIRRWMLPHDLLAVVGLTYDEDAYTELMAWALHPETDPPSASARQHAWLASLPFVAEHQFERPAIPRTQVLTADGIPDLVLMYDSFTVIVEAKTGTLEHTTPSGTLQTLAYAPAVASSLSIARGQPIYTVFITPDRRPAANPQAINVSFFDFAISLARRLDSLVLQSEIRSSFAVVLTNLLRSGLPIDVLGALRTVEEAAQSAG